MYFAIGGRRVQSGLYRVTYTGSESIAPVAAKATASTARDLRHQLEAFHGKQDPRAVEAAWPHLGNSDRYIAWAARVMLEHQPIATWETKALSETDAAQTTARAARARTRVTGTSPHASPRLTRR